MSKFKIAVILFAFAFILSGCTDTGEPSVFDEDKAQENNPINIKQDEQPNNQDTASQTDQTPPADDAPKENQVVTLETSLGDIEIELFLEKMPITAGNFLKLAKEDFYDGITFHRVIPSFMIQGGDPLSKDDNPMNDGTGGPGYFIEDEFHPDFTNEPGTIAMANAGPGTGGSQFFINVVNNDFLDSKHPVFGKVLKGMDIVQKIVNVDRDSNDRPFENVVIQDVIVE